MNKNNYKPFLFGCGCAGLFLIGVIAAIILFFPLAGQMVFTNSRSIATQIVSGITSDSTPIITPTINQTEIKPAEVGTPVVIPLDDTGLNTISSEYLNNFYEQISPGVVSVYVLSNSSVQAATGAGSGFVFDEEGHIVTNNHVIANAEFMMVIFHDGTQKEAQLIGNDPDSDLAVIQVSEMPDSVIALPIGNLDTVQPGDWVIAIGNPFGLNSSMTLGIISAVGRAIPSGATPFAIPMAIQTDAAINPGNSGGPLLNLQGQVIGVNAQIASQSGTSAGVGFSIPANIVSKVVPTLIEVGTYQWSWLGIRGTSVDLFIQEANNLPVDHGAYLVETIPGGPAALAGLQGGTEMTSINGFEVPTGGDVIVQADETVIESYADLQLYITEHKPGTTVEFSVIRDGEMLQITVELAPRPET